MVVKHASNRRFGFAFGEHELGILEFDDSLAERLPLLDVLDGEGQRALDHCLGMYRDDEALPRKVVHKLNETLTLLCAEQVLRGQSDVLKEQLGGVGGIEAELLELASAAKTRGLVGLDH